MMHMRAGITGVLLFLLVALGVSDIVFREGFPHSTAQKTLIVVPPSAQSSSAGIRKHVGPSVQTLLSDYGLFMT